MDMVMWCSVHMEQSLDDQCVQPDLVGKIKSRVQNPALSQAELLKVLPVSVPIRLSGEIDTDQFAEEQERAAQSEQMEGIVDERVRAEITRPLRSIEDDNDVEVKRQWLGEPLATIPETSNEMLEDPVPLVHEEVKRERLTKKTSREPMEISGGSGGPMRMGTSYLRVSSVNAVQKPSTRNKENIAKSRAEHIKHLLETGAVKDWNRHDAIKTGAKILSGKMVDDAHKEKSRYCAREFATYKDPSVFAAASDVDNICFLSCTDQLCARSSRLRNPNQKSQGNWSEQQGTSRVQETWLRSCRGQASRKPLRLCSMETGLAIWRVFDGWWMPITPSQQDNWTARAEQWCE